MNLSKEAVLAMIDNEPANGVANVNANVNALDALLTGYFASRKSGQGHHGRVDTNRVHAVVIGVGPLPTNHLGKPVLSISRVYRAVHECAMHEDDAVAQLGSVTTTRWAYRRLVKSGHFAPC